MPIRGLDRGDSYAQRFRQKVLPPTFAPPAGGRPGMGAGPPLPNGVPYGSGSPWEVNRRQAEAMLAVAPPLAPGTTMQQAWDSVYRPAGGPLYGVGGGVPSGSTGGGGGGPLGLGSYLAQNQTGGMPVPAIGSDSLLAALLQLRDILGRR